MIIHRSVSCCKVGTEDLVNTGRDHLHLYFVLFFISKSLLDYWHFCKVSVIQMFYCSPRTLFFLGGRENLYTLYYEC